MSTADRMVASAQELLWARGYVGTSPKAIQQLAGAGQGSMYHHFAGKADLAAAAIARSGQELRDLAERQFTGDGPVHERIEGYLTRERDVLRGCRIGRMAQDPDVVADPRLREPVRETFGWLHERLTGLLREGVDRGEYAPDLDPADTAAAVAAVLQGGYVLARAADSAEPFDRAVRGVLALLAARLRTGDGR